MKVFIKFVNLINVFRLHANTSSTQSTIHICVEKKNGQSSHSIMCERGERVCECVSERV
jgi:hypothetical protein